MKTISRLLAAAALLLAHTLLAAALQAKFDPTRGAAADVGTSHAALI